MKNCPGNGLAGFQPVNCVKILTFPKMAMRAINDIYIMTTMPTYFQYFFCNLKAESRVSGSFESEKSLILVA